MTPATLPWRVLLVGGSSGTGKTTLAQRLAAHYGVSTVLVDDLRLAIQAVTTPEQYPDLHTFVNSDESVHATPEAVRDGLIRVAHAMIPALRMVIAHHIAADDAGPVIIEGDGIVPALALAETFADMPDLDSEQLRAGLHAVWLYEPDVYTVWRNSVKRGRGLHLLPEEQQHTITRGAWLFGQWLRAEAQKAGLPVLHAQPYDSLAGRVRAHWAG